MEQKAEHSYETNDGLIYRLFDYFQSNDYESFRKTLKTCTPFQLDKRFSELNYRTLLHKAAETPGYEDYVSLLITAGVKIDHHDFKLYRPTHYAVENGNLKALRILLNHKADVNCQNTYGDTALHVAVKNGYVNCVKELIKDDRIDLGLRNEKGQTALEIAKINGDVHLIRILSDDVKTLKNGV